MTGWRLYRNAFRTILTKEILRFSRIWIQTVLPPMVTTALYFVIFGQLIGERLGEMGIKTYIAALGGALLSNARSAARMVGGAPQP